MEGDREVEVAVSELAIGDLILVRPGGRMPVDGVIATGQSELDRSLLTGETLPVFAEPGTRVSAGEVNLTGPLVVRAEAVGEDTSLHRMADLVAIAESGRSRYTSLADSAAKLYAPGVHILSALAFIGWYLYTYDLRMFGDVAHPQHKLEPGEIGQQPEGQAPPPAANQAHRHRDANKHRQRFP